VVFTYAIEEHHYDSIDAMLDLAGLQSLRVCGDGNCGYYSAIASCDGKAALDHLRSRGGGPSMRDYTSQQKLREACVRWLLNEDNRPYASLAFGRSESIQDEATGEFREVLKTPLERDDAAIKRHLQGKCSSRGGMGLYATSAMLRAMAAVKGVRLVCIDSSTSKTAALSFMPDPGVEGARESVSLS